LVIYEWRENFAANYEPQHCHSERSEEPLYHLRMGQ
jgi:hypothetical protein